MITALGIARLASPGYYVGCRNYDELPTDLATGAAATKDNSQVAIIGRLYSHLFVEMPIA
jgi:hypothetical protein